MSKDRKLRLLCLHGYRQDAETFRKRIGALRKKLRDVAEFEFVDGTQTVLPGDESGIAGEENRAGGLGWWFSRQDDFFRATHCSDYEKGLKESITAVETKLSSSGPYDGLLGFSQGAALAAIMCAVQQEKQLSLSSHFRFVILVSAFKSRCSLHDIYYRRQIDTPSLHIIGDNDQVVSPDMSQELTDSFIDPVSVKHDGGHFVPATGYVTSCIREFLGKFIEDEIVTLGQSDD